MSHGRMSHEIAPHTPQRKNREHLLANSRQLTSTFTATTNPMSNVNMGEASGAHETPTASPGARHPETTTQTTETRITEGSHAARF